VLLLTDPVDQVWVDVVTEFDGVPLASVAQGAAEADDLPAEERDRFAALLAWLAENLAEDVREVRLTGRLTTSPACLVGDSGDMSPTLEKLYRAMGQELPHVKRILELNPGHPLVEALRAAHAERPDDAGLTGAARLLHDMALLAEGGDLADPSRFVTLLAESLQRSL
jgi:molecular chaperone HtpG